MANLAIVTFGVLSFGDLLPQSHTREVVVPVIEPALELSWIYQRWPLFAPVPETAEFQTFAAVTFLDGSHDVWMPGNETNRLGTIRHERWRKWDRRLREDASSDYWPITAQHVVSEFAGDGRDVTNVLLVRRWSPVPPFDQPPDERVHLEFQFFEWDATNEVGRILTEEDQVDGRRLEDLLADAD